ncbi:guanine nucleotide exchange factor DBS-like isoform X3 [Mya arenaria]|uniref:guanine nucleotide exchange factor DBS-like isoform X3 n=1 Tax=Mya arenaria TaxID=6604 RepID=UPI0022E01635|nr:guanine nucleotide exchange factor DBS-like isoform X3 [Mya arenaria]
MCLLDFLLRSNMNVNVGKTCLIADIIKARSKDSNVSLRSLLGCEEAEVIYKIWAYHAGDGMGMETCPYSVLDVAQLLQTKFAFISGAKAQNGAPIMTFPDRPHLPEPSDEEYRKVVSYLCSIPALPESQLGFVLLVDRRQSGWGSVKTILMKFSGYFPCHIQVVFLLQPHGFFQRAFSDYRSKFKEELEYKVVSIDTPEEMFAHISADMVTTDMGGNLEFDAEEWTQNRSALEKFSSNTEKIALTLTTLILKYEHALTPNDVEGTEKQIHEHSAQRRELLEDLESSTFHGQTLLTCIKGDNERTPLVHVSHVLDIERLLVQLDETKNKFEEYWQKHHLKQKQSLQMRKFEDQFKQLQVVCDSRTSWLEESMKEIGDSVKRVDELTAEFDVFEKQAKQELETGEKMRSDGEQYILDDHYAVDSIRPKCIELQRMCDQYRQLLRRRREILTKSHDLQERIEKANKWCTSGVDMLTTVQLEGCHSNEAVTKAVEDIDKFVASVKELKLNNPKEFRQLFDSVITSDTRASVQKVLKKMEDVQTMCATKRAELVAQSRSKPVQHPAQADFVTAASRGQTTVPDYDLRRKGGAHSGPGNHGNQPRDRHRRDAGKGGQQNQAPAMPSVEKSARIKPDIGPPQHHAKGKGHSGSRSHHGSSSTCSSLSTVDSVDAGHNSAVMSEGARNSVASMSTTSGSSALSDHMIESLQEKRQHVMNELIETEMMYVQQLHDILRGYYCEMDNRAMIHLIPPGLASKKDILFGNLDQIYNFHHDVFLKDLQSCADCPMRLGKCFVNRKDEFQRYSIYCMNKPRSEELRTQVGDHNPFFKECQRKLGHKLPLGAYLLKPVQRITKYQLLLKEMLKYAGDNKTCRDQLEESLNTMLEVARIVNNSMYQVAIQGFPGNLSDLGKLLMQGSFNVSTEHKHEKIRDIRFKPMHRHLFLYEKAILMCKRKEDTNNEGRDGYSYKNMLRCNQVGLTENIKGDKRKFELWLRGREEVYIVTSPSLEVKDFWVKEIKKVLMGQFDEIKLTRLNLGDNSPEDLTRSGSDSGMESWRHRQGSGNNNSSTLPQGLAMLSPETPPDTRERSERWSDVSYTDSEPEVETKKGQHTSPLEPAYLQQFIAIADYAPVDDVEMALREGDRVEILRTGSTGWWLAHHMDTNEEGWVPSTFLDPLPNTGPRSLASLSSIGSGSQPDQTSHSSVTSGYSATSPVDETTI